MIVPVFSGGGVAANRQNGRMLNSIDIETATAAPNAACESDGGEYELVARAIRLISLDYRQQPTLDELARSLATTPDHLAKTFRSWAGLSPKAFLQAVTLDHAKRLLEDDDLPLLDASIELGLSGPGRLHDLFVTHESMSPGEWKRNGETLTIRWGRHPSPFGAAVVMSTDRGLAGLAFDDDETGRDGFEDLSRRWPAARFVEDEAATAPLAVKAFGNMPTHDEPLRVVLIGTDFQVRVWESLLRIPRGRAMTYGAIAERIGSRRASRAVGAAVGANPISFVVPCHRALGSSGKLTGYHWGLTRKRAMLGWEAGQGNAR